MLVTPVWQGKFILREALKMASGRTNLKQRAKFFIGMIMLVGLLAIIPAAYVVGSVPFGLIVGLSRGVDARKA